MQSVEQVNIEPDKSKLQGWGLGNQGPPQLNG